MTWSVYEVYPIDFMWGFLPTISEFGKGLASEPEAYGKDAVQKLDEDFREAQSEVDAATSWEGDFRGEVSVFLIPIEGTFDYGFVWKQENNGTTFVVSPVKLDHLEGMY